MWFATIARRMRLAALIFVAALLVGVAPATAQQTQTGVYTSCAPAGDATILDVSGASCEEAQGVAAALAAAPAGAAATVLRAAGWDPLRALVVAGRVEHDLVATRARAALHIRRPGLPPDLDGWSAGRELLLARGTLVPGERPPPDAVLCTSAFLISLPSGRLGGLSAAHCAGMRRDGTVQRRNAVLRRPPEPGVLLGRVVRNVARTRPLDALVLPVPAGPNRTASADIDRRVTRPPWSVAGVARPLSGRQVCFSGRTSGIDRCGQIVGARARPGERLLSVLSGAVVRCTNISAQHGDSGSAVYTAPRADGSVRAVGIAVIVIGPRSRMCFTPLLPVLDALGARLVTQGA
jgi:hypothetical protein